MDRLESSCAGMDAGATWPPSKALHPDLTIIVHQDRPFKTRCHDFLGVKF